MAECWLGMQKAFCSFPRTFRYPPGILPPGEVEAGKSEIQGHSLGHLKGQKEPGTQETVSKLKAKLRVKFPSYSIYAHTP